MTTKESVDEKILLVDGSATSTDVSLKKRWRSYHQGAADLMWNDRFWAFKRIEGASITFSANPATKNYLPTDWGSFEALVGLGVFPPIGSGPIYPCHASQMVDFKRTSTRQVGQPQFWCVTYDADGLPYLDLFPIYAVDTAITLSYLRRSPILQYVEPSPPPDVDSGTDEISFFPQQWQRLIGYGAEWIQKVKTGNALAKTEHEIWKAGLDQMRAREATIVRGVAPWRPERLGPRR